VLRLTGGRHLGVTSVVLSDSRRNQSGSSAFRCVLVARHGWSTGNPGLDHLLQPGKRLSRTAAQLAREYGPEEQATPSRRQLEFSTEANDGPVLTNRGNRDGLVVDEPEGEVDQQVQAPSLRVCLEHANVDPEGTPES